MPPLAGDGPRALVNAAADGLFDNPTPSEGLRTSATRPVWRVPVILVSYSDSLITHSPAEFNTLLFDTSGAVPTGSAFDYYQWVSGGRLRLRGEVVATVTVPSDRYFYAQNNYGLNARESPNNIFGLVWEAIGQCQHNVNWSDYDLDHDGYVDMLWVVHAGVGGETSQDRNNLWSLTSRLTNAWRGGAMYITDDPVPGSINQKMRIDRFTILPELSAFHHGAISEIGVYCHEFGHALGLPDLYTPSLYGGAMDMGPGGWSLMSSGAYGDDNHHPEYPAHMGAWPLQFLGWDRTFRPTQDTTVVLEPIENGGSIMELWYQGESESEHFLVENRQALGFDVTAPAQGLIVYHVDDVTMTQRIPLNSINSGFPPGLRLVEADGRMDLAVSANRGEGSDVFTGESGHDRIDEATQPNTSTFYGTRSNVGISEIRPAGHEMRFKARVQAVGWRAPQDFTDPAFRPVDSYGEGRVTGVDRQGVAYWVTSENRDGTPQIFVRGGRGEWGPSLQVSASTRSARDPAIAVLPGGDLAIVWSDDRSGRAQLYYRSRIRGVWTAERQLLKLKGDCRSPAIGADARGGIAVAFQYSEGGEPQIRFMRFTYFSPFGQSVQVTTDAQRPGAPVVAMAPNGVSYVLWCERSASPQRIWFARSHPDSGIVGRYTLTYQQIIPQLGIDATVDRNGDLYVVWQTSGPGSNQIHLQRRSPNSSATPSPIDSIVDSRGYLVQNPVVAVDTALTVHIAYELYPTSAAEIRYLRGSLAEGWDAVPTRVDPAASGSATHPQLLPASKDELNVAFLEYLPDGPRAMIRRRFLGDAGGLSSVASPPARVDGRLRAGPNPLRAGRPLSLWYGAAHLPGRPVVEIFDLAGRRLAETPLFEGADGFTATVPASATRLWTTGVCFARVAGAPLETVRLIVIH